MNSRIAHLFHEKLFCFLRLLAILLTAVYAGSAQADGELIRIGTLSSVKIGSLAGINFISGISADGNVIAGTNGIAEGVAHAFRWTANSGMQDLGTLDGKSSSASSVSADGSVVVGWSGHDINMGTAFRWTAGDGMQPVAGWLKAVGAKMPADYLAWTVFPAFRVSADGNVIVGTGRDAANDMFAWRVRTFQRATTAASPSQSSIRRP